MLKHRIIIAVISALLIAVAVTILPPVTRDKRTVYTVLSGRCYHRWSCRTLIGKPRGSIVTDRLSAVEAEGYRPCPVCRPASRAEK